jgi:pyruvate formate-lyase/glycerol dehydratase family glycyl radical enzyme
MKTLTRRIQHLREHAFAWQESQRAYIGRYLYHALQGLAPLDPHLPWMQRKAVVLAYVIEHIEPEIHDEELVIGYNFYGSDAGMWAEVSLGRAGITQPEHLKDYLTKGQLTQGQLDFIWQALPLAAAHLSHTGYYPDAPQAVREAEADGVLVAYGTAENHTVIDYSRVVHEGFAAICGDLAQRLDACDWSDPASIGARLLLESALTVAQAAGTLGKRYAAEAARLLATCRDPERAAELQAIIATTSQVPELPARTFREAVQSLWFAHILNTWEDGINANSLGRLDQILYPYYAADVAAGRLTPDEAFDLLCCLWIKLYRDYDVQQVTLGGVDAQGNEAANDLTYMMLDVTEALDFVRCLGVRLHASSPERLLARCLEIVRRGKGIPFFFNDDTLIPALVNSGISLEDARDYTNIGCVETTIPGKANPHAVSNHINLPKCLELALNNGVSMTTGVPLGPQTGDPAAMQSIEDVIAAYEQQVAHFAALACWESNRRELIASLRYPMPYKSMLTEGCLDSGRDFNAGGARYNFHESQAMGIPNVADSLAALDEMVFRRRRYTLVEIVAQLRNDYPDEAIRQAMLRGAPKYGNDVDAVDCYAVRVFSHFCAVLRHQKALWGQGFFAQPFTYLWHIDMGKKTAATPDGRHKGEIFAYSVSPMQGRDSSGLTAAFNSLAKLPHHLAAGSTSAIIEITPELFSEAHLPLMVAALRTALISGVGQLQFNVVNAETLRKAQQEPDKYQNLAVRVSGFSQRFCLLDRELQDHIIARTKHNTG